VTCGVCGTIFPRLYTAPSEHGFKNDGFYSLLDTLCIICTGTWKGKQISGLGEAQRIPQNLSHLWHSWRQLAASAYGNSSV